MPGPWEKYATPAAPSGGPWEKFGAAPPATSTETPSPKAAPGTAAPSKEDLAAFMKARYSGPNHARNIRQKNDDAGLTPTQIWQRSQALQKVARSMPGVGDITNAVQQTGQGEYKKALHSAIVGTGKAAAVPFLAPAAIAAPGATAAGLAAGAVGTEAGVGAAKLAGADEDTANLAGDATGLVAGGLAGHPGKLGSTARAGATGALEGLGKGRGVTGRVASALSSAWESAEAAWNKPEPIYSAANPRPAPGWSGHPEPQPSTAQPVEPIPGGHPSGRKAGPAPAPAPKPRPAPAWSSIPAEMPAGTEAVEPIQSDLQSGRKVPTVEERERLANAPKGKAKKAPAPAPAAAPDEETAKLDEIAVGLGGKDFASASPLQQEAIRKIVLREATPKPAPAPVSQPLAADPPADNSQVTPSNQVEKPEVPPSKPKTVKEMLDAEMAANRAAAAPKPTPAPVAAAEPTAPPPVGSPAPTPGDYYRVHGQVKKAISVANDMHAQGITAQQLEELPLAQRKEALGKGHSDETFSRILFELRGLETGKVKPTPTGPVAAGTPPPAAKPVTAVVRTPSQTKAKVEYKISEAKDLKTSFDSDYNKDIGHQPRDTTRAASRQRVEARKADMDPESMGPSVTAGDGAPITRDGHAVTRNHGLQALKENYSGGKSPKAAEYKNWVAENAGLAGMSPDDVHGMDQPVLHRDLKENWDHPQVKKFADEANMSSTARMSEPELARQMSKGLTGSKMGRFKVNDAGVPDAEFVRDMVKDLPVEEQGEFQQRNGEVSQKGVRLVRNAVFERAYTNTGALETMAESTNPQVKNITTAMLNAAPDFARLADAVESGDAYDLHVGNEVGRAMETIERLRQEKKSVPDYLKQGDMMGKDPAVQVLLHMFSEESRRPTVIRDTLKNYAQAVFQLGKPNQGGLFGDSQLPSKVELLDEAYKSALKSRTTATSAEPSLFEDAK